MLSVSINKHKQLKFWLSGHSIDYPASRVSFDLPRQIRIEGDAACKVSIDLTLTTPVLSTREIFALGKPCNPGIPQSRFESDNNSEP